LFRDEEILGGVYLGRVRARLRRKRLVRLSFWAIGLGILGWALETLSRSL
jgi:hypothetical protein